MTTTRQIRARTASTPPDDDSSAERAALEPSSPSSVPPDASAGEGAARPPGAPSSGQRPKPPLRLVGPPPQPSSAPVLPPPARPRTSVTKRLKPAFLGGSLAARIAVATAALTAVVVSMCATGAWFVASVFLERKLDQDLLEREQQALQLFHQADLVAEGSVVKLPREFATGGLSYFQLVDDSGVELLRSPSLGYVYDLPSPVATVDGDAEWLTLARGHRVRVSAKRISLSMDFSKAFPRDLVMDRATLSHTRLATLWVGEDAEALSRELTRLAWVLILMTVVATGLAGAMAWWMRRAIMRPVERLADALGRVSAERLTERIVIDTPRELVPIRVRLNSLLKELEQVLTREKTTIANIAHELRTPISGLRTELEFALVREPQGMDADGIRRCLGISTGMQALVTNLLQLARLEAGSVTVVPADVDLEELVEQSWDLVAHRAAARRIRLSLTAALEDPMVVTCPEKSRVVITNLLDNAVSHAPEDSAVVINWSADDRQVMVRMSNPVNHPVDTSRLFVPFWRAEESRTGGDGDHCGLGLALVARIMRLLGGRVGAESEGGKFVVEVAFPRRSGDRVDRTSTMLMAVEPAHKSMNDDR